jgi:hypothetical protein
MAKCCFICDIKKKKFPALMELIGSKQGNKLARPLQRIVRDEQNTKVN